MPDYPRARGSKAERIRELAAKGLNPSTIAARLGVTHPTVSRALNPEKAEQHRTNAKRTYNDTQGGNDETNER